MNYFGKVFTATAAFVLGCANLFAQQPAQADTTAAAQAVPVDTAAVAQSPFPAGAPFMPQDAPQKLYHIRHINIHGVEYLNKDILKSSVGLIEGDSIYLPSSFIANVITRIWSQRLFSDVQVGADIDGDSIDLQLLLQERPRVNQWSFTGITKSKQKDLLDKLKLKRGSELSDYVLDKNKILIKKYWSDKGFRNATVDTHVTNDTLHQNMVNVTFAIDRHFKVKIGAINFTGNNTFSDKRLRRTFKKTHKLSINLLKSAKLKETDYEDDKVALIDYYNSNGYRNATIVSDSIYPINDKRIGINIALEEGNKYYIRDVSWVGNSIYDTEFLQRMLGIQKGDIYDKKSIDKRLGIGKEVDPEDPTSVSSQYQNSGYLMSQIEPAETIIAPDSIDIQVKIFEGKPFKINEVGITGNQRVSDEVIRRELYTHPGELYNRSLLMQTIRTLGSMGHFNPEAIAPDIKPVSNELVDINWPLQEQASDQFNVAGGFGSNTFVGSVGVTLNNLSIKNFFKKGAWRPYPMGQNQKLSIQAQTNGTYYKAFAASFTDPWLGGHKPNSFTVEAHYSEENNAYYVWQTATQYFRTYGVSAGLGKRLTWPDPYFTFYGEATYERYGLKNWNTFGMRNGAANLFSLKFVLERNSVDQPFYPRRGSDFMISVQATPPYSLWDGKDYKMLARIADNSASSSAQVDRANQERYRWVEFHKWLLKGQWFQALTNNKNLVLMLGAEMGYLGHYNNDKISPFERFDVGGDGMTGYNMYGIDIIPMRGYDDSALNPVNQYAIGYNKYTAELRYPVILKPSSQIYVLAFLEGGNAFSSWEQFSPFKIKRAAGIGVRLYLPVVGMLGINWGWGFDSPAGKTGRSGSQFQFQMGQQF